MILCRFRYRPKDVDCKNCTEYRKKRDTLRVCPWLEERAEALRKEKSAAFEEELPPLHFRLPEMKQLLSNR